MRQRKRKVVFGANIGLYRIERNYEFDKLIMNVASFNQRAIKVYHSCGFQDAELIKRSSNGGIYEFLTLIKKA